MSQSSYITADLGSKNDGFFLEKECKMTGKAKTSGEPLARWYIELSATLVSKRLEIKDCILKGDCIYSFAITHGTKL